MITLTCTVHHTNYCFGIYHRSINEKYVCYSFINCLLKNLLPMTTIRLLLSVKIDVN